MATAREENPYEGGGEEEFGKFGACPVAVILLTSAYCRTTGITAGIFAACSPSLARTLLTQVIEILSNSRDDTNTLQCITWMAWYVNLAMTQILPVLVMNLMMTQILRWRKDEECNLIDDAKELQDRVQRT